jgi:GxxExxY protein
MTNDMPSPTELTGTIIGAAIDVHSAYRPGLLESVYTPCLAAGLLERGLEVAVATPVPLTYRGVRIERAFVIDLLVENTVIVEVKSVSAIAGLHVAQLLSYLRLTDRRVGLLLNFNVVAMKDGIRRVVNDLVDAQGNRL